MTFYTKPRQSIFFLLPIAAILTACANEDEAGKPEDVSDFWFDYRISGEEELEAVTCMVQFREGSPRGEAVPLPPPGSVSLDGQPMPGDSAGFTGFYYELQRPAEGFAGSHRLTFTDRRGRSHTQEFTFTPFRLLNELPSLLPRGDIVLDIEGLPEGAELQVILTDTSFTSTDLNETDTVRGGRLVLERRQLRRVRSGPVSLQLIHEEERPVREGGARGRIFTSYSLRREFDLH